MLATNMLATSNKAHSKNVASSGGSSASSVVSESVVELPFNPVNKVIDEGTVRDLLSQFSVKVDKPLNLQLYRTAMVHKSYCTRKNENAIEGNVECPEDCVPLQEESHERLEFLGDSVLGIIIANYVFQRFPEENEGFLTKMRTKLVNGKMLAHLCVLAKLQSWILISKQIEDNNGRMNRNILEDTFEAFLGAMYLDTGGLTAPETWIINLIEENLDFVDLINQNTNYKDTLIKWCLHNQSFSPRFLELNARTLKDGSKQYTVCIKDNKNATLGTGTGETKKAAENDASKNALVWLGIMQS